MTSNIRCVLISVILINLIFIQKPSLFAQQCDINNWILQIKSEDFYLQLNAINHPPKDCDSLVIPFLIQSLGESSFTLYDAAMNTLTSFGHVAVKPLLSVIDTSDTEIRWKTIKTLGMIKDTIAIPALERILKDEKDLSMHAAMALSRIGEPAISPLVKELSRGRDGNGYWARDALVEIGAPCVDEIIPLLNNSDFTIFYWAIWIVGEIKDKRATIPLINVLVNTNNNSQIRSIFEALGKIGDTAAVIPILNYLKRDDNRTGTHGEAIRTLGLIGDTRALDVVIKALGDSSTETEAAEALGLLGDPKAVPFLIEALSFKSPDVRWRAAKSLGKFKDDRAVESLAIAIKDNHSYVRKQAAHALASYQTIAASKFLINALKEHDLYIIDAVPIFYIGMGLSGSEPILIEVLEQSIDRELVMIYLFSGNQKL